MELSARELRIGNLVDITGHADEVGISAIGISEFQKGKLEVKPIPLTDELLINFGFKLVKNEYPLSLGSIAFVLCDLELYKEDKGYSFGVEDEIGNNSIFVDFLYVHQLQNFYSAVKNKELNIKL